MGGLTQIKQLTGKEQCAKIFVLYMVVLSCDCVKLLSMKPAKNEHHTKIPYGHMVLYKWYLLLEDSLITMQWLQNQIIKGRNYTVKNGMIGGLTTILTTIYHQV